jgi:hypothetical protein
VPLILSSSNHILDAQLLQPPTDSPRTVALVAGQLVRSHDTGLLQGLLDQGLAANRLMALSCRQINLQRVTLPIDQQMKLGTKAPLTAS